MLKLPKGLKKKKKGKKSKKDQELFNEEELEQYRREHQKQDLGHQSTSENPTEAGNDDEWQKFKALTAGVDSILKQKQEELDRIKSTSFFQRVSTASEKKLEEEQKEKVELAAKEAEEKEKQEELAKQEAEKKADVLAGAVVELSDSESEEEEEDIFDTAYIDVIAAAEVGLVNVDSPVEEEDEGPDPFDTSYADKVIKGPEVSKRGKKLVNIGSAVEVLTGRVETVSSVSSSRRPRRGPQNLLLENFDDADSIPVQAAPEQPKKTLLDDPADEIPDIPIDLSVSLHLQFQQQKKQEQEKEAEDTVNLDEFDDLKNKQVEDDDEFSQLAVDSLTHKDHITQIKEGDLHANQGIEGDWAFFEQNKGKQPPPRPAFGPNIPAAVSDEDLSFQEDSSDPFDTAFVTKILPATLAEDADFDPRAEVFEPEPEEPKATVELFSPDFEGSLSLRKFEQPDLLRGSNTDLSQICVAPIVPITGGANVEIVNSDDPFDTSAVDTIVAPGKTELKFLEKELLSNSELKKSLSDPDFDPRAEEEVVPQSPATKNNSAERKSSLVLNITPVGSRLVSFAVPATDLLKTEDHSKGHQKPLTPYYTKAPSIGENDNEDQDKDPFDTSYLSEIKPSETELNLIEKEILQESHLKHSLSDPDFDPRAISPQPPNRTAQKTDLLGATENEFTSKVLTPAVEVKEFEYCRTPDPFDTSAVQANIQPGQAELKVLVSEFVPPSVEDNSDLLADSDQSIFAGKILTPQPSNSIDLEEDVDPFDTSFANNIQPGQAEIRVIETELIHN